MKNLYFILILTISAIAIVLDRKVIKKQTGFALGWPYYLYVLLIDLTVYVLFYII